MSPTSRELLQELTETRDRWWLFSLLFNLLCGGVASAVLLLGLVAADWKWHLPGPALRLGFVGWLAASLGLLGVILIAALARQRSLAALARRLEMSFPELEGDLISFVQLAESDEEPDAFQAAAVDDAARRLASFPYRAAPYQLTFRSRWRLAMQTGNDVFSLVGVLLLLLSVAILLHFLAPHWSTAFSRTIRPWHVERLD